VRAYRHGQDAQEDAMKWAESRRLDQDYDIEIVPRREVDRRAPSWELEQVHRIRRYNHQQTAADIVATGKEAKRGMIEFHDEINAVIESRPDLHPAKEHDLRKLEALVDWGLAELVRRSIEGC
jgi:hypothetical protein